MTPDQDPEDVFWAGIAARYPRQTPLLNLNNAAVSPPVLAAQAAMIDALQRVAQAPDVTMWTQLDAALPRIKQALAELTDCDADEIALNRNASEGLSTAIFGMPLQAGDAVLVSAWDYPSARAAWQQRAQREGLVVIEVDFDLQADADAILAAYARAWTPRVRAMVITHMLHWNGHVLPAQRLCDWARGRGIRTLVDAAQSYAQLPLSFRALGCDYLVTSLHKWLGAPVGNGMLVVRRDRIDETWPLLAPFDPPPLRIDKFDHWNLGTLPSALQAGILPALALQREIGGARKLARLRTLTRHWATRARAIPGLRLHTRLESPELGALALFSVDGLDARWIERRLREDHAVHVKYREVRGRRGLRVSPHLHTSFAALDDFVAALGRVVEDGRRAGGRMQAHTGA